MSIKVGIGSSSKKDLFSAAKEAIWQAKADINNERIDLAIVFNSIDRISPAILNIITSSLGDIPILGCSTAAVISSAGIFKEGLAIMLLSLPEGIYLNTACAQEISTKGALNSGEELGEKLLYGFHGVRRDLTVILSDGMLTETSNFILGLQEKIGRSSPLIGGGASDNLAFKKTCVYFNQESLSDAVCSMLWGGKFNFGVGVKHGWKPLGKPRYVTRSTANIVHEIDGKPAINIYEEYLASALENIRKDFRRTSILYPLGTRLPNEEEYLLRNVVSVDAAGSLAFQGNIPEGSQVRLMIGTKESCLQATTEAAEEAKTSMFGHKIDFVLVFNSVSRYILLRRQAIRELEIIKEILGQGTKIIGLYTYGEHAPVKTINSQGRAYMHNQTITILAAGGGLN